MNGKRLLGFVPFVAIVACSGGSTNNTSSDASNADASVSRDGSSSLGDGSSSVGVDTSLSRLPLKHRATADACSHDRGPGDADAQITQTECTKDADCTAGNNGRCLVTKVGAHGNVCSYDTCFADSDCGSKACHCRESASDANTCVGGNCRVDADCGAGGYCSPSVDFHATNFGSTGYYCHTSSDRCINDADCRNPGEQCAFDPTAQHWACSNEAVLPP